MTLSIPSTSLLSEYSPLIMTRSTELMTSANVSSLAPKAAEVRATQRRVQPPPGSSSEYEGDEGEMQTADPFAPTIVTISAL